MRQRAPSLQVVAADGVSRNTPIRAWVGYGGCMRRLVTSVHWAFFAAVGIAACGGTDDAGLTGGGKGGSGNSSGAGGSVGGSAGSGGTPDGGSAGGGIGGSPDGGTGALGGAGGEGALGGTGGGGGYTVDDICSQLPQKVCQGRASCCNQTYGFNQPNCESVEKQDCDQMVAEVKAGTRTFDPAMVDVCLSDVQPLLDECLFTGDMEVALYKAINTCGKIFPGKGAPGAPCTMQHDCAPSSDPNGYFGCSGQTNQCYQGTILSEGTDCNYYFDVCDEGLDCATSSIAVQDGTCTTVTPINGPCTSSNQCGLGNYCTGGTCKLAKQSGTCSSYHHCASLNCDGGECAPPTPIIRQADCGS